MIIVIKNLQKTYSFNGLEVTFEKEDRNDTSEKQDIFFELGKSDIVTKDAKGLRFCICGYSEIEIPLSKAKADNIFNEMVHCMKEKTSRHTVYNIELDMKV